MLSIVCEQLFIIRFYGNSKTDTRLDDMTIKRQGGTDAVHQICCTFSFNDFASDG